MFAGLTVKSELLQATEVIAVIAGLGSINMVIVKVEPIQPAKAGVIP